MSKPANKTAIGMFVVGALALAVAAILVLGSGKFFTRKDLYVAYFEGSVKGILKTRSISAPETSWNRWLNPSMKWQKA